LSAAQRREQVITAAIVEFGNRGLEGATTEAIAKRVGVSQPYLFRLFPSKRALFIETCRRCAETVAEVMEKAAGDRSGHDALEAMGSAYMELLEADRNQLLMQLQQYAACHDPEIQQAVRGCMLRMWTMVERVTGLPVAERTNFFAIGMLCNVVAAMSPASGADMGELQPMVDALRA
jgi:AcrR family transcriptional regulator